MSKRIQLLIIEDSENDALLLDHRLARSGFDPAWKRVETAESLRAALGEQAWDIAFSDHSMRGFGSRDALQIVKEQGRDTSGYSPEATETAFIFREGTNFLQKPYQALHSAGLSAIVWTENKLRNSRVWSGLRAIGSGG